MWLPELDFKDSGLHGIGVPDRQQGVDMEACVHRYAIDEETGALKPLTLEGFEYLANIYLLNRRL